MRELAVKNPEALERFRLKEIENIINGAPEQLQRRLRGLQFQIDCKLKSQKSPMGACITISRMMHDSLNRLNSVLNGKAQLEAESKKAKILSFHAAG